MKSDCAAPLVQKVLSLIILFIKFTKYLPPFLTPFTDDASENSFLYLISPSIFLTPDDHLSNTLIFLHGPEPGLSGVPPLPLRCSYSLNVLLDTLPPFLPDG